MVEVLFSERTFRVNLLLDFSLNKNRKEYSILQTKDYKKLQKVWLKFGLNNPYSWDDVALSKYGKIRTGYEFYEYLFKYIKGKVEDKDLDSVDTPFDVLTELDPVIAIVSDFQKSINQIHEKFKPWYSRIFGIHFDDFTISFAIFPCPIKDYFLSGHTLFDIFYTSSVYCSPNELLLHYEKDREKLFAWFYMPHECFHLALARIAKRIGKLKIFGKSSIEEALVHIIWKKLLYKMGLVDYFEYKESLKKYLDKFREELKLLGPIWEYNFDKTIWEFLAENAKDNSIINLASKIAKGFKE